MNKTISLKYYHNTNGSADLDMLQRLFETTCFVILVDNLLELLPGKLGNQRCVNSKGYYKYATYDILQEKKYIRFCSCLLPCFLQKQAVESIAVTIINRRNITPIIMLTSTLANKVGAADCDFLSFTVTVP